MELQKEDNWNDCQNLDEKDIIWTEVQRGSFFFFADHNQQKLSVRLNNFPEEPAFTLFRGDQALINFNNWPENWIKEK